MDPVMEHLGNWQFSRFDSQQWRFVAPRNRSQAAYNIQSLESDVSTLPWIIRVSDFAQSGVLQIAILGISVIWTIAGLLRRGKGSGPKSNAKASAVRWQYEACSQVARIVSLVFVTFAYVQREIHLLNVVLVAYAFVMGVARLGKDLRWRHLALHQVNFTMTAMLFVLVIAQCLPCIQSGAQCARDTSVVASIVALLAAGAIALVTPREWVPPQMLWDIPGWKEPEEPAPEETCCWLNYYFTYEWLTPIVWKGTMGRLDMSGIPRLAWYDDPLHLLGKVRRAREISKSTLWTTFRYQRSELSLMALWAALAYMVENVAPFGMFKLLDYISAPDDMVYKPWVWLTLMFLGPLSRTFFFQQYIFTSTRLVVRIKSGMTQELYHKALESMEIEEDPFEAGATGAKPDSKKDAPNKTTSAGRLATLMAADVDTIFRARDAVMVTFGVSSGTVISLFGLYKMLGWASLVGTAILICATPLSLLIARKMYFEQRKVRRAQDSRISLVTEYLASIRAIKYFGWEDPITDKIVASRAREQNQQWRVTLWQALMGQITQIFPYISLLVMFGLHVGLEQKRLDASTAFTTIFLIKNVRRNIMQASNFSRSFAGALVSFGRLDKYFSTAVPLVKYPTGPLRLEKACLRRNKKATFSLQDISLDFVEGGLNVLAGPSGSGKSTLLLGILGETYLEGGRVTRPDDVAYASQSSWLQNESIKDNILFGSPMDEERYNKIIEACCLTIDFNEIAKGEDAQVGENGTALSGGQKARVALARALYCHAPLLLLDDIFAALDAKTAAGVWKYCFCSDLLKGRTTVLVTNVPWIAAQADLSIMLDKGEIKSVEPNIGVVRTPITIAQVLGGDADEGPSSSEDQQEEGETETGEDPQQAKADPLNDVTKVADPEANKNDKSIVDQEMKASGKIGRLTFIEYMKYWGNPIFATLAIGCLIVSNIFFFGGSYWLSIWVEAYEHQAHVDIAFYMGIFSALSLLEIFSYAVILIVFEWGSWRAAKKLHNDFIRAVMNVSLSWFKIVPIGRITNRFASDIASLDGMISSMLRFAMDAVLTLLFRVAAVSTIMPIFMVPALFVSLFGVVIGEMYTRTAVVIKRLTSSSQSPVFSQFADTLAGLSVIRARRGMPQAFGERLAEKLRIWSASAEANYNCNRWVAVRVDFVTALVSLSAGIIAVSKVGLVAAGLVGFSLTNANGLSQTILILVRTMNDLEVEMQSFHRVNEYLKLDPEEKGDEPWPEEGEYADDSTKVIPKNWPNSGEIEFKNVTVRYDEDGPDILTDVNLKFKAGERVAVVGRTGSGKSTLVISLLRFTHVVSGQILFDGIDITKIPRHRLRQSLTIIPQEAVLFNGTVESNLDPTGLVSKERLEKALDDCRGTASFAGNGALQANEESNANGVNADGTASPESVDSSETAVEAEAQTISLATEVDARGENFSHGQRQVLSLARALVRNSKLMLLDEATASMDYETDRGIQQILRKDLEASGKDRTLVTIAHRLRTIIDYDTVVVMGAGKVVEYGSPRELYESKGQFYDMMYHSGEMDELQEMFEKKDE